MDSLEARSRDVQERTFCKWSLTSPFTSTFHPNVAPIRLNTKLESQGYQPMTSLVKDLSDGVRLIQLMVRPSFISQAYSYIRGRKSWVCTTYLRLRLCTERSTRPRRRFTGKIQQEPKDARSEGRECQSGSRVYQLTWC